MTDHEREAFRNQCLDGQRKTIRSMRDQLEWLWANCKIVYWPKDDRYPIEHNPHARKYSRDTIEAEMPNNDATEGRAL